MKRTNKQQIEIHNAVRRSGHPFARVALHFDARRYFAKHPEAKVFPQRSPTGAFITAKKDAAPTGLASETFRHNEARSPERAFSFAGLQDVEAPSSCRA